VKRTFEEIPKEWRDRAAAVVATSAPIVAKAVSHAPVVLRGKAMAEAPEKAALYAIKSAARVVAPVAGPAVRIVAEKVEKHIDESREPTR
jgi:hypothetical protein